MQPGDQLVDRGVFVEGQLVAQDALVAEVVLQLLQNGLDRQHLELGGSIRGSIRGSSISEYTAVVAVADRGAELVSYITTRYNYILIYNRGKNAIPCAL